MPRHQKYVKAPNHFPQGGGAARRAVVQGVYLYDDEEVEWQMAQSRYGARYAVGYKIRQKRGVEHE